MAGSTQRGGSEKGGSKGEGREGRKRDGATVLCFHLGVMIPRWAAGGEQTTVRARFDQRKKRKRKKKEEGDCLPRKRKHAVWMHHSSRWLGLRVFVSAPVLEVLP
jgi:hypothetical protein